MPGLLLLLLHGRERVLLEGSVRNLQAHESLDPHEQDDETEEEGHKAHEQAWLESAWAVSGGWLKKMKRTRGKVLVLLEKRLVGRIGPADMRRLVALELRAKRLVLRVLVWLVHDRAGVLELPGRCHVKEGVLLRWEILDDIGQDFIWKSSVSFSLMMSQDRPPYHDQGVAVTGTTPE